MANLKDVIYLSAEDYNTLYTNGTVTINGVTLTYDANNVYIVPDDTDAKISTALTNYIAKSSTTGLVKNDGTIDTNTYATTSQLPTTMGASGSNHASGLVPDTPSTSGTTKYLREDGTWVTPPNNTYTASSFDIKDLTDSTSLRSTWNSKQDSLSKRFYTTNAFSGSVDLFSFSYKNTASQSHLFIVSISTNWDNYVPIELVAVCSCSMNSSDVNYLIKCASVTNLTITRTGGNSNANGKITLTLSNPMQGVIDIRIIPLDDNTSFSFII